MKAIILTAHGSRSDESNQEVIALAEKLKDASAVRAEIVLAAFLDIAKPSIAEAVTSCAERGATDIMILPYFLNSGRHVRRDIPAVIEECRKHYPGVRITIGSHLGASELIAELLIKIASAID